jgi:hypothetical protein
MYSAKVALSNLEPELPGFRQERTLLCFRPARHRDVNFRFLRSRLIVHGFKNRSILHDFDKAPYGIDYCGYP